MIADKCEMILNDDTECDHVAVGFAFEDTLVCEECAVELENQGEAVDYFGDDN